MAALALPTSPSNRKRHETLQRFMLINDSVTVAIEIPAHLTREDVAYYRSRRFDLSIEAEVITGHIDFHHVQERVPARPRLQTGGSQGKTRTRADDHLRSRARAADPLAAQDVQKRWFDEKDYFEFYRLAGVYKTRLHPPVSHTSLHLDRDREHGKVEVVCQ